MSLYNKKSTPDLLQHYRTINMQSAWHKNDAANGSAKKYPYPAIGIYNGHGASHSWLWFVEILDKMGFWNVQFVDEQHLISGVLDNIDVLLVSGGDTFAIAESLDKTGAEQQ